MSSPTDDQARRTALAVLTATYHQDVHSNVPLLQEAVEDPIPVLLATAAFAVGAMTVMARLQGTTVPDLLQSLARELEL